VAGIPDQVGPHGMLAAPGDVSELADAIGRTVDALATGSVHPQVVSEYATARFSIQAMVDKHLQLYENLLHAGRKPIRSRKTYWPVNAAMRAVLTTCGNQLAGKGWLSG
ncbi:MAG: hypothetical protein LC793_11405, partial [Thermomicrobia bacterium]|nr:hypothetical protein [Thermomicrobia bacterium]